MTTASTRNCACRRSIPLSIGTHRLGAVAAWRLCSSLRRQRNKGRRFHRRFKLWWHGGSGNQQTTQAQKLPPVGQRKQPAGNQPVLTLDRQLDARLWRQGHPRFELAAEQNRPQTHGGRYVLPFQPKHHGPYAASHPDLERPSTTLSPPPHPRPLRPRHPHATEGAL